MVLDEKIVYPLQSARLFVNAYIVEIYAVDIKKAAIGNESEKFFD